MAYYDEKKKEKLAKKKFWQFIGLALEAEEERRNEEEIKMKIKYLKGENKQKKTHRNKKGFIQA